MGRRACGCDGSARLAKNDDVSCDGTEAVSRSLAAHVLLVNEYAVERRERRCVAVATAGAVPPRDVGAVGAGSVGEVDDGGGVARALLADTNVCAVDALRDRERLLRRDTGKPLLLAKKEKESAPLNTSRVVSALLAASSASHSTLRASNVAALCVALAWRAPLPTAPALCDKSVLRRLARFFAPPPRALSAVGVAAAAVLWVSEATAASGAAQSAPPDAELVERGVRRTGDDVPRNEALRDTLCFDDDARVSSARRSDDDDDDDVGESGRAGSEL